MGRSTYQRTEYFTPVQIELMPAASHVYSKAIIINEKLVVYLNAMKQVNPEMYDEFANIIAVIISENNETVKRRTKKKPEPVE